MKYALKLTPGTDIETTMWLWFHEHGAYYIHDRDGMVRKAEMGFIDSNLTPEYTRQVEIVPFSKLPDHIKGHDPRDIVWKLPREYDDD